MKPYYEEDGITIYCGDCREVLPGLGKVDLVLTDPPYGINWVPRVNHSGDAHIWVDDEYVDPAILLAVGTQHIIWGANYFCHHLEQSGNWLIWVKRPIHCDFSNDKRTYSTCEMAWSSIETKTRFFQHTWDGGMRSGAKANRTFCHPSQKPLELMLWCIGFADEGTILDPFMGSGTTLVAAKQLGRKAIGIELEEKYCEIAVQRLRQGVLAL